MADAGDAKRWGAEAGSLRQDLARATTQLDAAQREAADARAQLRQTQDSSSRQIAQLEAQVADLTQQLLVRLCPGVPAGGRGMREV